MKTSITITLTAATALWLLSGMASANQEQVTSPDVPTVAPSLPDPTWAGPEIEFLAPGAVSESQRADVATERQAVMGTPVQQGGGAGFLEGKSLTPTAEAQAMVAAAEQERVATTEQLRAQLPAEATPAQSTFMDQVMSSYAPVQKLKLTPGDNIMVPVAVGLMNRVSTTFNMAAVKTHESKSIIEVDGGVVYITIKEMKPVGLLIYEEGVPESAVSITLVPDNVPPVMISADISVTQEMLVKSQQYREEVKADEMRAQAEDVAKSQNYSPEYVTRIKEILTPIGQGKIPDGFSMSADLRDVPSEPCSVTLPQHVGQRLIGSQEFVDVVAIKNTTKHPYALSEKMCLGDGVMAVAIYNTAILQPGQGTEVYIMRDKLYEQSRSSTRQRQRLVN